MIVFDLACVCGCIFEGWFHDRSHFEDQRKASFLECPRCGGREIRKILSPIRFQTVGPEVDIPGKNCSPAAISADDTARTLDILQEFVQENFEDVGADLAKKALKMHYGVEEPRNIRGVTTEQEEKELQEEGIELLKIPIPLKDRKTN